MSLWAVGLNGLKSFEEFRVVGRYTVLGVLEFWDSLSEGLPYVLITGTSQWSVGLQKEFRLRV